MNTSSDIWLAFGQTFSMLFLVLAFLIFAFYLVKKISTAKGIKGGRDFIKVLTVHHLSPKEKLVLLDVLGEKILIGVTSSQISKIASFDKNIDLSKDDNANPGFSHFLNKKLKTSLKKEGLHEDQIQNQIQEDVQNEI